MLHRHYPRPAMRWRRVGDSPDVLDQRGAVAAGGPAARDSGVAGGLGLVGLVVVVLLQLLGGGGGGAAFDVARRLRRSGAGAAEAPDPRRARTPSATCKDFSVYVFDDVQRHVGEDLRPSGKPYEHAKLVSTAAACRPGCGTARRRSGPFYCPADQRVYLDLSFYDDMKRQLGAPGDFAWAYVIAHEMGHHVQHLLGTERRGRAPAARATPDDANELSVRLELQADCYAGVWAHARLQAGELEPGDVEEAISAAQAVGDDRLQRRATARSTPTPSPTAPPSSGEVVRRRPRVGRAGRLRHLRDPGPVAVLTGRRFSPICG